MNELERAEAEGYATYCELAGGTVTRVTGGICLSAPAPVTELNRVVNVGDDLDLDAVTAAYAGARHHVSVPPAANRLGEVLEARGYTPGYPWMKFERAPSPAPPVETSLRIEEAIDPGVFGATAAEGFGLPPRAGAGFAVLGLPGWHCFMAWDGDQPAAAASLFVHEGVAWLGGAATRPPFRGRGAQTALLAARITRAREVGVHTLTVETGKRTPGRPDRSYKNILAAGFREAYLRPNWASPT